MESWLKSHQTARHSAREVERLKSGAFENISYEFHDRLTLILAHIQRLIDSTGATDIRDTLSRVRNDTTELLRIVDQLKYLSGFEVCKSELHDGIARHKQGHLPAYNDKFLMKVVTIIEDHVDDENFTIDRLSREVGYSNMQLYRKIKALTGETPSVLLRTIRLNLASGLLLNKSDNVSQIAFSVGFRNLSYFNKCFKKHFGVAPGKFAKHKA